jgi:uncharacterized OB-fold protein
MPDKAYAKPLPSPSPETQFFWDKARAHELWLPYCRPCARHFWYPRDFCPACGSREVEWRRSSGNGTVHTFAVHYRAFHPGWAEETPYITALVELEDGVRVFTNLVGMDPDPKAVRCDMAVEAVFEDVSEAITLVKFRPSA